MCSWMTSSCLSFRNLMSHRNFVQQLSMIFIKLLIHMWLQYCRLSQSLSCSSQCTLSKLASYILPLSAELPLGHLCTPYNSGCVSCDGLCLYAFEAQGLLLLLYHDRLFIISLITEYYLDKEYVNSRQLTLMLIHATSYNEKLTNGLSLNQEGDLEMELASWRCVISK